MLRVWSVLNILTWNKRDLEEKYINRQDTLLHSTYKLQVFIKFSYLGDHVLPTKLRSERCANDLNHFQLKVPSGVPSGTFSIAEISPTQGLLLPASSQYRLQAKPPSLLYPMSVVLLHTLQYFSPVSLKVKATP